MSLASHRCCGRLKILKQAWIFSASHIITLSGSYIYRKAINKDKPLSSGVLRSRQQSSVSRLPGTPPPSVYQVTHGTALQAAECYVRRLSCGDGYPYHQKPQALQAAERYVRHLSYLYDSWLKWGKKGSAR